MTKKNDLLKKLLEVGAEKPKKDVYMKRFDDNFTVQSIDYKTLQRLREQATYPFGKKGETKLNDEEFNMLMLAEGIIEPSFHASEVLSQFGTPTDAIQALLNPGEISKLGGEIMSLSGYGDDEEEELKN